MKKLSYCILIVFLIFLNSCTTVAEKYDLYHTVMDTDDINTKKGHTGVSFETAIPKDSTKQEDVSFSFRVSSPRYITVYVHNNTPIWIDDELSFVSINGIPNKLFYEKTKLPVLLSRTGNYELMNIFGFVPSSEQLYDTYKSESFLIKENEKDVSVINFTKENSPYRITGKIVYYTEKEFKEAKECPISIFQSVLYTIKDVSPGYESDVWWNFRKNERAFIYEKVTDSKTSISGDKISQVPLAILQLIVLPFYLLFGGRLD